jgi:hypothetical protein
VRTLKPHTLKGVEEHTLYLLSPKQTGCKLWRFAVYYLGQYIIIGKGVGTRDIGRAQGTARYYVKAQEIRGDGVRVAKPTKPTKPSYSERVAAALAVA